MRVGRIAVIGGLTLVLFGGGALGLLRADRARTPGTVSGDGSALLAPGGTGDLDVTIASLQARLRAAPRDWRSYGSLGLAYLQKGRLSADPSYYPRAEEALGRSLDLNGSGNFDGLLGMGVLALGRHDFAAALDWGERARDLNPYSAPARGVIGDALLELGRYRRAADAYQEMIDLRPDLASFTRVSYYRELTGDVSGAIGAMTRAVDLAGTPDDAAWAGYQLGELYLGSERVDAAARAYRIAAASAPDAVLPRVGLAKVAAVRGDLVRATRILSEVVHRYPAPEFVILLGDLYRAGGWNDRAVERYRLVRAMQGLFRAGGVDTDLETALFDADHGHRLVAALGRARNAYERRPSVAAADVLAWTLYANGRYVQAAHFAREALRLGTRSALFHFHAGMIALRLGRIRAARHHLSEALAINRNFSFLHGDRARHVLERLR